MISQYDLINQPEEYKPLSTIKGALNIESRVRYDRVPLACEFMHPRNQLLLIKGLHHVSRNNGGRSTMDKFRQLVPNLMKDFTSKNDLEQYITAEYQATGVNNWHEALRTINNQFIQYAYNYLRWNHFNPFREWATVGATGERKHKRFQDLLAHDIPTLDLEGQQEIQLLAKFYRHHNKIPFYQHTMHKRHYDNGNEGLRNGSPDRASLDTPIHGYNMRNVEKILNKFKKDEWWGIGN